MDAVRWQAMADAVLLLLLAACTVGKDETAHPESGGSGAGDSVPVEDSEGETSPGETADTGPCDTGVTWYADLDGDHHGDPDQVVSCDDPRGASRRADDCDDTNPHVHGGAAELATSGRDDDCDGRGGEANILDVPVWRGTGDPWLTFGYGVALPGDLDGDRYPDLVVGSYSYPLAEGDYRGAVLVKRGPLGPSGPITHAVAFDTKLLVADVNERVVGVNPAGDVDGDGISDLLVETTLNYDGLIRYYLQRGPVPSGAAYMTETAQAWLVDSDGDYPSGRGIGDIDGDGLDDLVMSNVGYDGARGAAYVLRGPAEQTSLEDADMIMSGTAAIDYFGYSSSFGDLDGDGTDDFGVAAASARVSYLILDYVSGHVSPEDLGVAIYQDRNRVHWHNYMTFEEVGDLNGDGYGDVGFSECDWWMYAIFGPFEDAEVDLAEEWDLALISDNGGAGEASVGMTVPLGDWDGDGHDDLAVANWEYIAEEYRWDPDCWPFHYNGCDEGALFLLAGPLAGGVIDLEQQADLLRPEVPASGFYFPWALSGGEDLDGDGFPDLAIGDMENNAAYVLFGGGLF